MQLDLVPYPGWQGRTLVVVQAAGQMDAALAKLVMLSAVQLVHWSAGDSGGAIEHIPAVAAAELAVHPAALVQPADLHHLAPQL